MDEGLGNVSDSANQPPYINPQLDKNITSPKQKVELDAKFNSFFKGIDEKAAVEPAVVLPDANFKEFQNRPLSSYADSVETPDREAPVKESTPAAEVPEVPKSGKGIPGKNANFSGLGEQDEVPNHEQEPVGQRDIDSLELHAGASPEQKGQFSNVKEIAKTFKEKWKAYEKPTTALANKYGVQVNDDDPEKTFKAIEAAIESRFQQVQTPADVQKRLEAQAYLLRQIGVRVEASIFEPVINKYKALLDEMAPYYTQASPDVVRATFNELKTKYVPSNLTGDWWKNEIAKMTGADDLTKERFWKKVVDLSDDNAKAEKQAEEYAKDPGSFEKFQALRNQQYNQDYQFQVKDETERIIHNERPHLKEVLPKSLDGVSDPEERAKIEAHNAYFAELEKDFSKFIGDCGSSPRANARRAMEYIEMRENFKVLQKMYAEKEARVKELEEQLPKLRDQVTARRRASDMPYRGGTGKPMTSPPAKEKLPTNSRESLADSFKKNLPQ